MEGEHGSEKLLLKKKMKKTGEITINSSEKIYTSNMIMSKV